MTRRDDLIKLRDAVRVGRGDTPDFSALVSRPLMQCKAGEAYRGSLDAAKSLHEAVLHERSFVEIHWSKRYDDESRVSINLGPDGWHSGASTPARAWLLAILDALIAQESGE